MKKFILAVIMVVLIASLACRIGSINIQDGVLRFEVSISEEQLNSGERRWDAGDLFSGSYQVDLRPGKAVITGTLARADGREIAGNVELGLSAVNGELQVNVLAVNADGILLQDERIQRIQEAITEALSQIFNEQQVVKFESITITDDAIEMTIREDLPTGR